MARSVPAAAHAYRRLADNAALKLLNSDNRASTSAILTRQFDGTHRTRSAAGLIAEIEADLELLRDNGFPLPQTAQAYVTSWVSDGYLIRRPGEGREETLELTAGAASALAFLDSLDEPRTAVTSSRFTTVADLLSKLARDTDPDTGRRLESLIAERDRLDAEIARTERGEVSTLPASVATERLRDALTLASEIGTDFSRVSTDLEELNRELKNRIIRSSASRAEVLDDIFAGVDLIEDSPAGRTFRAFHAVVLDPERAEEFDDAVADILDRPFADEILPERRHALRELLSALQRDATAVRATMTGLSRSLRQFVATRAWQEHRRLEDAITEAQRAVLVAQRTLSPITGAGIELAATSVPLSSISAWTLHNPADVRVTDPVTRVPPGTLDLADLRRRVRESEIDFAELNDHIASALAKRPNASVGDVLADHPATQGLASVIGLLSLAQRHGQATTDTEVLHWQSQAGAQRFAVAPRHVFTSPPKEWSR